MNPVSSIGKTTSPAALPSASPKNAAVSSPAVSIITSTAPAASPTMDWRARGEFHLQRKELDPAIEAFTKALQEAEANSNPELIGEGLKDLGRAFLEKEQWPFAAKIFNGAYALLQKSSNEKSKQAILALMAEVERRFLEKVWKIKKAIDPKVYLERRQKLQTAAS